MTAENIIKGLQLLEKIKPVGATGYHVRAEHDEIIAGSLDWPITDLDRHELEEVLGWMPIEDYDGWRAMA